MRQFSHCKTMTRACSLSDFATTPLDDISSLPVFGGYRAKVEIDDITLGVVVMEE